MPVGGPGELTHDEVASPRTSGEGSEKSAAAPSQRVSGAERIADSPAERAARGAGADTLLSAGPPANPLELMLEDSLTASDARFRELEARVSALEASAPPARPKATGKPWLWLVFLVALAGLFQLLQRLR